MNWNQLQTILWLRWRLTRNQWMRNGGLGAVVAAVMMGGAFALSGICFLGGLLGGGFGLGKAPPLAVDAVWAGVTFVFLILWVTGLVTDLQRSETIDLQRLMHLPVALGQMFFVNYIASHFTLSIVLVLPAMMGLALGLAYARGLIMLLLVPLAFGVVFMITAWTYYLRGWLATLMSNPRRRRAIIMGITLGFVLVAQAPNLYFNVIHRFDKPPARGALERERRARTTVDRLVAAQKFVPPFWLAAGAGALAEGRAWPAVLGVLGGLAFGTLGLHRAYRSTIRFYQGAIRRKEIARVKPPPVAAAKPRHRFFLELQIPVVPERAGALALASLRSMSRAPEVKMALATSFLMTLFLGAMLFLRNAPKLPESAKLFAATGAVAAAVFTLVQFLSNQFGFDRDGFRALVLSPAPRRDILFGKNLATLPVGLIFGGLLLGLVSIWLHLPALTVAAGVFQLATMLLLAGLGGNVLSILVPYRIAPGSIKPTKMPTGAMLMIAFSQLLFPLAVAPVFVGPLGEWLWRIAGGPPGVPVNLILSIFLAALTAYGYGRLLDPLGRLLQRREIKILDVVSVEVE